MRAALLLLVALLLAGCGASPTEPKSMDLTPPPPTTYTIPPDGTR